MAASKKLTHIDPTVDFVAKYILGSIEHIDLLINFLNAVLFLEDDERVVDATITNPFNEKTYPQEKTSAVDIRARDQKGHIFHIEIQVVSHEGMPWRMVYYWSSIFASQLKKKEDYTELKPVISIWVLVDPIFPDEKVVHIPFGWHCAERNLSLIKQDLIHVLQLRFLPNDDSIDKGSDFWTWIKFFRDGASIDLYNPPTWAKKEIVMALRQFTEEEQRRALYFARLDAQRNAIAYQKYTQKSLQSLQQERDVQKARADQAEIRADQALEEKEKERLRADQAERAQKQMRARLRELGIDPNQI